MFSTSRPRRTSLQNCPPEICERIFSFACQDDGSTGRSLSLVSRYIRDASETTRYRSVAVGGPDQLAAFVVILQTRKPAHRVVQHLFLSYCALPKKIQPKKITFLATLTRHIPEIHNATTAILELVSSTLETLTLFMVHDRHSLFPPVNFPVLVELTIYSQNGVQSAQSTPNTLPSLRRLHIAGGTASFDQAFALISAAPTLTHLRFTGAEHGLHIPSLLRKVLGYPTPQTTNSSPQSLSPLPKPQTILIQHAPPAFHSAGLAFGNYCLQLTSCQEFVRDHRGDERIFILTPISYTVREGVSQVEARSFWLSRLHGGQGCWDERSRLTFSQVTALNYLIAYVG
ncbi:hypothetical protein JAAARDRAFT_120269 [Jaapia argillacea MUCL 33604]|uniref:F-box domain-containing protein n=1 Tax=Jaapia argillacea MUCL 33604 TaxID=933084 RepID=A0A067Q9P4_9AGAM|nr:hypothetical protein JAAARDRAFT_120269 [Jaapia argillacea MUCL 33604]